MRECYSDKFAGVICDLSLVRPVGAPRPLAVRIRDVLDGRRLRRGGAAVTDEAVVGDDILRPATALAGLPRGLFRRAPAWLVKIDQIRAVKIRGILLRRTHCHFKHRTVLTSYVNFTVTRGQNSRIICGLEAPNIG